MNQTVPTALRPIEQPSAAAEADDHVRAGTYSLLAALLAKPPGRDVLALLRSIPAQGQDDAPMAVAWEMLRLAGHQASVEALDDEFHDLFIGIGRGELVPYGSWYMTGFLMDKPLAYLRQDLNALGIERQAEVCEPEDHVAALCEAMAVIIHAHDDIDFEVQCGFFREHIGPWMGAFFGDLEAAKSSCFYRSVGRLGREFMQIETTYLGMLA